jgi:hypothetical protein
MTRRFALTLTLILTLLLGVQSLAVAATSEQLDQQQADITNSTFVGYYWQAQTFKVGSTGTLTRVELWLQPIASVTSPMTVEIRPVDAAGAPMGGRTLGVDGIALASAAVTPSSFGSGWVSFSFTNPLPVSSGDRYAIVVAHQSTTNVLWYMHMSQSNNGIDGYSDGSAWMCDTDNCWQQWSPGDVDFTFRTYVEAAPTYTFSGFQAPVNPEALNVAKAGQAIPLKFRVTDSYGNPISDLASISTR